MRKLNSGRSLGSIRNLALTCAVLLLLSPLVFADSTGRDIGASPSEDVLERFEFQLTWFGIRVGTGVLELKNIGEKVVFSSTAWSADWVSRIYPVFNHAYTVFSGSDYPVQYENTQKEGSYRSHRQTLFEPGRIRYEDRLTGTVVETHTDVRYHDVLSAFLAVRKLKLVPGRSVNLDIYDKGEGRNIEIRVSSGESIETALGTLQTVIVEPQLETDGLFRHRGPMRIWLTEDPRRIPVRLEAKVMLGSVRASLSEAKLEENGGIPTGDGK